MPNVDCVASFLSPSTRSIQINDIERNATPFAENLDYYTDYSTATPDSNTSSSLYNQNDSVNSNDTANSASTSSGYQANGGGPHNTNAATVQHNASPVDDARSERSDQMAKGTLAKVAHFDGICRAYRVVRLTAFVCCSQKTRECIAAIVAGAAIANAQPAAQRR